MKVTIEGTPEEVAEALRKIQVPKPGEHVTAPCPHGRASWGMCPHCLGLSTGSPPPRDWTVTCRSPGQDLTGAFTFTGKEPA